MRSGAKRLKSLSFVTRMMPCSRHDAAISASLRRDGFKRHENGTVNTTALHRIHFGSPKLSLATAGSLNWRARHRTVRAENTAIAWLGAQHRPAASTLVEELAGVGRHYFCLQGSAGRTSDRGFRDHRWLHLFRKTGPATCITLARRDSSRPGRPTEASARPLTWAPRDEAGATPEESARPRAPQLTSRHFPRSIPLFKILLPGRPPPTRRERPAASALFRRGRAAHPPPAC